ncbi:hypothetical protein EFK07_05585 [Pseudomonas putida]|uniref:Uncharacterized protein n=1 Tax=Pseudomonas putida TaxID=303 RepID=A0A3M8TPU6_PSEPU|nr:hypothetical protein EFK07_05585 [Pseudomonas putida]
MSLRSSLELYFDTSLHASLELSDESNAAFTINSERYFDFIDAITRLRNRLLVQHSLKLIKHRFEVFA